MFVLAGNIGTQNDVAVDELLVLLWMASSPQL